MWPRKQNNVILKEFEGKYQVACVKFDYIAKIS
jgi:hypothetical protein